MFALRIGSIVRIFTTVTALAMGVAVVPRAAAQKPSPPYVAADLWIESNADTLRAVNHRIWSHPEVGLQEHYSSAQLATLLERAGFEVERGVAGMPTAFVASAGQGRPIVGILAEYDALPGVSQAPTPDRRPREENPELDAGHACGHSIFGTASTAAAIATWEGLQSAGLGGTIRLYGTPAEETGVGKVYMVRAGLFSDLDAAFHWHAGDKTRVSYSTCKAVISVKYRFSGLNAHASLSPHQGRSALDAVELMNVGANYLREHLREDARIHYVITEGGGQPNVVPPTAEVWYYLRADVHQDAEHMLERMREIADGATRMTRTTVEERIDADSFELLPNRPLSELLQRHLDRVGPPLFDERERAFARSTQVDLPDAPEEPLFTDVMPLPDRPWHIKASTDVGNVSWQVPTGGINVACYTNGAPGHSWQIVACTGMSIGEKGMIVAARTLAGAALELLADKTLLDDARRDFDARRGSSPVPRSVLPQDQEVPTAIR
ncbi:MAG: amidohydrolase [Candidatus Latescibacterota bacterium]|nr:MAG: amidohydrolase [Candidatus Latescibacterota bacterium]